MVETKAKHSSAKVEKHKKLRTGTALVPIDFAAKDLARHE